MATGEVEDWYPGPGQGFIRDSGGSKLNFSSNDLTNPGDRMTLHEGDKVKYAVKDGGRATAVEKT
ncbi:hypothetical protein [Streptomyces sp. NPDC037389]|uniref:cold-shock protein n=1 Tax=Streptomyces sp. NPDC037389 TaxID=3155369 RepID=UPI0033D5B5F8